MYKFPKLVTQKALREIAPPNISPPGSCAWKIALKYKVKQRKNGSSPSNYKQAQSILKRKLPSVHNRAWMLKTTNLSLATTNLNLATTNSR